MTAMIKWIAKCLIMPCYSSHPIVHRKQRKLMDGQDLLNHTYDEVVIQHFPWN